MKYPNAQLVIVLTVLYLACPVARASDTPTQPKVDSTDLAQRIHRLVNVERKKHKLPALSWDSALARIAHRHSHDMAQRNYLSHDSPQGQGFRDRYQQGDYHCLVTVGKTLYGGAENIALGRLYNTVTRINGYATYDWNTAQDIARKTVEGWMKSSSHRENILTPHWKREGIGVDIAPNNRVLITQNFC